MEQHVKTVGMIYIVLGALAVFSGLLVMGALMAGGAFLEAADPEGAGVGAILAGVGFGAGLFIIAWGILQIVIAVNLRSFKPWARIAQIIISAFWLLSIPLGTALGLYVLWVLLNKDTEPLFRKASGGTA